MKKKYTAVSKSEIEVHKSKRTCYVTGPSRVCDQLLTMGAKLFNKGSKVVWSLPIGQYPDVQQWYDNLPDVITEFTVNIKKRISEQLIDELGEGELVTINYGEGLERGFQVVEVDGDERILREVVMKNGKPKKNKWKYIEYRMPVGRREIDQRPVIPFRK